MYVQITSTPYSVKNVQTFEGRAGRGFSCSLYKGKKKIANVCNEANGGCYRYSGLSMAQMKDLIDTAKEVMEDPWEESHDELLTHLVCYKEIEMFSKRDKRKGLTYFIVKEKGEEVVKVTKENKREIEMRHKAYLVHIF